MNTSLKKVAIREKELNVREKRVKIREDRCAIREKNLNKRERGLNKVQVKTQTAVAKKADPVVVKNNYREEVIQSKKENKQSSPIKVF
jgi:hypothetical protein